MQSTKSNEQDDNLPVIQDKYETQPLNQNQQSLTSSFKLPKIINRPVSRTRVPSRKQIKPATVILPSLNSLNSHNMNETQGKYSQKQSQQNFRNTDMFHLNKNFKKQDFQMFKDDFALDVQSKLKSILGQGVQNKNKNNINHNNQDDDDFQQKINQNKQFIKMHRQQQKNQKKSEITQIKSTLQPTQKFLFNPTKITKQKISTSSKPQSTYEKKMKQYNFNNSLQNKYLQKKKQSLGIIIQKPPSSNIAQQINNKPVHIQRAKSKKILSMKDTVDEVKINFGYKQFKSNAQIYNQNSQNNKPSNFAVFNQNNQNNNAIKSSIEKMNKKNQKRKTQQSISPRRGSLFDNIQSFLQNPTAVEKHQKFYKEIAKKLKNKDMNKLQEQIKQITQKIGIHSTEQLSNYLQNKQKDKTQANSMQIVGLTQILKNQSNQITEGNNAFVLTQQPDSMQRTVRDWKRIQIKNTKKLNYQQSNFQKQLDYISYLQQKNSSSLTKFIDQQKIMVELQLNRRFSKSIGKEQLGTINQLH